VANEIAQSTEKGDEGDKMFAMTKLGQIRLLLVCLSLVLLTKKSKSLSAIWQYEAAGRHGGFLA